MKKHPLHHFELFLLVAQLGSFTAAAKAMGISKAAVSQTIKALEDSLKTPLLIRTTRSLKLTEEGEQLKQQCLKIKNEMDVAHDMMQGFHTEPSGLLRISCGPYYKNEALIQIIQQYQQQYSQVQIELVTEERLPDMQQENIDIVFGINWPAPLDVVAREIGKTRYVLCASPKYLEEYGTPQHLSDLKNHWYIPHSSRNKDNFIAQLKNDMMPKTKNKLIMNNARMMRLAALNDMGIIQLHDYMVEDDIKSGTLVEVLKNAVKPSIPLYIYYQKHRYVQPKIKRFVDLVLNYLNDT